MGLYFRQSIKVGPFRFNLSKSGFGMSAGVRGLRVGTGPRGHYIHAGANGFYYQQRFGGGSKSKGPETAPTRGGNRESYYSDDGVQMFAIDSNEIAHLDSDSSDGILKDINLKASRTRLAIVLPLLLFIPAVIGFQSLNEDRVLRLLPIVGVIASFLLGMWYDSYARVAVLMYDFDEVTYEVFGKLREAFGEVMTASCAWHLPSAGRIETLHQWKRNAGANVVVDRKPIYLVMGLPPVVKSNIEVPTIPVGRQTLYFFPDRVLLRDRSRYRSIGYQGLSLKIESARFIESGSVPSDAVQVGETWKYVNKKGGPDRRFNDNRILPVCLYQDMLIESGEGVLELIELSKVGPLEQFREAVYDMKTDANSARSS